MRHRPYMLTAALLVGLCANAAAAADTTIVIESGAIRADAPRFSVRVDTAVAITGVQHDLVLEADTPLAVRANGRPDCRGEGRFTMGAQFAFQPPGCVPGESCTAMRALILSLGTVDPIASGTTLYSCALPAGTPLGHYDLRCADPQAADAQGEPVDTGCVDGAIELAGSTVLRAGSSNAAAGASAAVGVALFSNELARQITAELDFAPLLARGRGRPACAAEDAEATFAYLPAGCTPGSTCTGVRATLTSAAPFADGAALFDCGVDVPAGTAAGDYAVRFTAVSGSTTSGAAAISTVDGQVRVSGEATPTAVPPTPVAGLGALEVGVARGAPGTTVEVAVTLRTGQAIAGVQNDLHFDLDAPVVAAADGQPACALAAEVDWFAGSTVAFQPPACVPDVTCTGVRAVLLTATAGGVIADGTALYTCAVAIDPAARGSVALPCSNQLGSTPEGHAVPLNCPAGRIDVVEPTATPTTTPVSGSNPQTGGSSSSGCTVSEPAAGGWWLLLPPMLFLRRRCQRR